MEKHLYTVKNPVIIRAMKFIPMQDGKETMVDYYGYVLMDTYNKTFGYEDIIDMPVSHLLQIIKIKHEYFFDEILINGGFVFNKNWYNVDENGNLGHKMDLVL